MRARATSGLFAVRRTCSLFRSRVLTLSRSRPTEVLAIDSAGDGFGDGAGGNSNTLPHQTNNGKTDIADACILGGVANMNTATVCTSSSAFPHPFLAHKRFLCIA